MAESDNESGGGGSNASSSAAAREQDRFLPIANVSRIMKKALPANAKISKEAKETVQECVSEFISFITGEASDKCQREKRKTVNGDDLLWAMTTLGFEDYVDPLKLYLQKFREIEGDKAGTVTGGIGAGGGGGGGGVPATANSQPSQKEGGGGGGMMMMSMVGQQMYGSSFYQHHHLNQYQHQHQHQLQMGMGMGMGDGSAGASSAAGINGTRGERI
ncbi:nuclear transcription factor Y subunit B-3-like [Ananas comosus]|uniref:Nuclear transcription factor Y subunit B-3-like n=1 Tax=Ananas comosus TaxID=4615 RepID=A0A6P5F240_ANACO|nr:nuclear transcription factor Y subunit B-3-like [Ananas comosus]